MDSKNNLLKEKIFSPILYQNLLSIIVINQNEEIIKSLKKICMQVYQPVEIIIIDNSSDEYYNIIDNYITNNELKNVSLYHTNSKNIYECINIGLIKSKGNYITFQFSQDSSSHLRFLYQIDILNKREDNHYPFISLCLSFINNETFVSPRSMCITRYVFQTLGYFNHELKEICFEEYLWRYLYVFENLYHEHKNLNFLKENEYKSMKTIHKTLFQEYPNTNIENHPILRQKYDLIHQKIDRTNKSSYLFEYKQKPFEKISYLTQVYNVLSGNSNETRITLVFFTNNFNIETIKKSIEGFYKTFQCKTISTIICHYNTTEESVKESIKDIPLFENILFLKCKSFSDAFYKVFMDHIETPYMFLLQDHWEFCNDTLFHPLSYILDTMDKYSAHINSLRFNSVYNTVNNIDKRVDITEFITDPEFVYTSGINNEPQILNVRHTKKFKLPFINRDVKEDGVSDQLLKKYNNLDIAMKLKSCLYGSMNYPPTSKNSLKIL